MFNSSYGTTVIMVAMVALICISIQKFFKKYLESDQYYYLKDITLVGAWALCGIWMPDGPLRITVAAGVASACIGFCQRATKGKNLRFLYFLIGLVFSLFGPRIAFIEFTNGEYYYLSYFASVAISTLWVGIFPIFFQEIDEIPGLCGLLLTVSWTMISVVILSSSQSLHDASQICMIGLVLLLVFWSRHIYAYRRLTEPLTGLWGTLFAGLSILGVSKGITFSTLALLPLVFSALDLDGRHQRRLFPADDGQPHTLPEAHHTRPHASGRDLPCRHGLRRPWLSRLRDPDRNAGLPISSRRRRRRIRSDLDGLHV